MQRFMVPRRTLTRSGQVHVAPCAQSCRAAILVERPTLQNLLAPLSCTGSMELSCSLKPKLQRKACA